MSRPNETLRRVATRAHSRAHDLLLAGVTIRTRIYTQPMTRSRRSLIAWLNIGLLLFAQITVAGYACPIGSPDSTQPAMSSALAKPCYGMDRAHPNLCKQHCEQAAQSVDGRMQAKIDLAALPIIAVPPQWDMHAPRIPLVSASVPVPLAKTSLYLYHCRFLI